MLRITSITTEQITPAFKASQNKEPFQEEKQEKKKLFLTLAGLAAAGMAIVGIKKTAITSYEEALKTAGVQIKDDVATLISSGEKFTGKIQRFEKRNRKETVEFIDGMIKEKIYHNVLGKELEGYFYKDGVKRLHVIGVGYGDERLVSIREYNGEQLIRGEGKLRKGESLFDMARKAI